MSDLISRQAAIDAINERWSRTENFDGWGADISEECEEVLNALPSAQQWIPCSERLPEAEYGESDCVLVTLESGIVGYLYFDGGCWCYADGRVYGHRINPVIAWMPLPEPYVEVEHE